MKQLTIKEIVLRHCRKQDYLFYMLGKFVDDLPKLSADDVARLIFDKPPLIFPARKSYLFKLGRFNHIDLPDVLLNPFLAGLVEEVAEIKRTKPPKWIDGADYFARKRISYGKSKIILESAHIVTRHCYLKRNLNIGRVLQDYPRQKPAPGPNGYGLDERRYEDPFYDL